MNKRTAIAVLASLVMASVAVAIFIGVESDPDISETRRPTAGQTVAMQDSYAFDVTDLELVMDKTEKVFVARVLGVESVDTELGMTTYNVEVITALRGFDGTPQIRVTQLGYVDEEGVAYIPEEQELLNPGRTYLLTGNYDTTRDSVMVYAGPHAIRAVEGPTQQAELLTQYRQAID